MVGGGQFSGIEKPWLLYQGSSGRQFCVMLRTVLAQGSLLVISGHAPTIA